MLLLFWFVVGSLRLKFAPYFETRASPALLYNLPMSHHKRRRPKNRRGGCLLCKSWKMNGSKLSERESVSNWRRREGARLDMQEVRR